MSRMINIIAVVMFAAVALAMPARQSLCAETGEASYTAGFSDYSGLSIEDLMDIDIAEVYSASKYTQKTADAPSSVSVITYDEIAKHGYRNLADILGSVRSFYTTYDRLYGYAGVRGLLFAGDYNSRILVMIDGHKINDPLYMLTLVGNGLPLDVDLIDRVEIIRGPSMSIYGSSALLAVVNIITRAGRDAGAEASVEAGSHYTYKGRASYGTATRDGIDALLSGSYYSSDGGSDLYYREYDEPGISDGHARGVDKEEDMDFFGRFSYKGFTLEGVYGDRTKHDPTGSYETVFNSPRNKSEDRQAFVELRYKRPMPLDGELNMRVYYDWYKYVGDYYYDFNEGEPPPTFLINKDYGLGKAWGSELRLTATLFKWHKLLIGGGFTDRFRLEQGNYDVGFATYLHDKRRFFDWNVYAQDDIAVLDNLTLSAGVGYNYFQCFGSSVNPRVAAIYRPFDDTTLKFMFGTGFRAPSVYELYYNDGYDTAKPNPDIDEERISSYELVLEQRIAGRLTGTFCAFYYDVQNVISKVTDPVDNLEYFDNTSDVDTRGLEAELSGRWEGGFEGRLSYSYQQAFTEGAGGRLPNSPRHMAKLNLTVPLWRKTLFAGFNGEYVGRRRTYKDGFAEEYFDANLTLLARGIVKGLDISASAYNLFNDKHGDPVDDAFRQTTIGQDGTTFRFKLTYRF